MARYVVDIAIPTEELLRYYRGAASGVIAVARGGARVRFPVQTLRPFVGHSGVVGVFVLDVDADNRLRGIRRLKQGA